MPFRPEVISSGQGTIEAITGKLRGKSGLLWSEKFFLLLWESNLNFSASLTKYQSLNYYAKEALGQVEYVSQGEGSW